MKDLTINKEFPIRIEDIARKLLIEKSVLEDRIEEENPSILKHGISNEYQIYCDYGYSQALDDIVNLLKDQPIFCKKQDDFYFADNSIEEKLSSKCAHNI